MRIIWLAVSTLLMACAAPAAAQSAGPSFDCARATTAVERAICGDPALVEADWTMGKLFAATRISAFGAGSSNMLPSQIAWLKQRKGCAAFDRTAYKSREECLLGWYESRNEALAIAALFAEPELALATLRKLDPELAPLYEAVLVYASHPESANWAGAAPAGERRHLLDLLRPQYALLQS